MSALEFGKPGMGGQASFEAITDQALAGARASGGRSAGDVPAKLREKWSDFVIINTALSVRAWELWAFLWTAEYPDRADEWEMGNDPSLMPRWREMVCDMLAQHHMAGIRNMNSKDYCTELTSGGLENPIAVAVTEFFFDVTWEDSED